jgi:SAM-dependent methyltransferase
MKPAAYSALAAFYDRLNSGIDYTAWADFICSLFSENKIPVKLVLDLACGTGNMTTALARRGYDMTGADISPDMLAEAKRRTDREGLEILYICQDMRAIELYGTVDAVVCCLDSVNYLTDTAGLVSCFSGVRRYLVPDGLFIFDVNTPYKFENIYGDRDYILEEDGVFCAWRNFYNKKSRLCRFELSLFAEDSDGRYTRCDEIQTERCWSMRTIKTTLSKCGMTLDSVYGGFDRNAAGVNDERWYFVARRALER